MCEHYRSLLIARQRMLFYSCSLTSSPLLCLWGFLIFKTPRQTVLHNRPAICNLFAKFVQISQCLIPHLMAHWWSWRNACPIQMSLWLRRSIETRSNRVWTEFAVDLHQCRLIGPTDESVATGRCCGGQTGKTDLDHNNHSLTEVRFGDITCLVRL